MVAGSRSASPWGAGGMGQVYQAWGRGAAARGGAQVPPAPRGLRGHGAPGGAGHGPAGPREHRPHLRRGRVGQSPREPRVPFLVMECLEGESLARFLLRERPGYGARWRSSRPSPRAWPTRTSGASSTAISSPATSSSPERGKVKLLDFGLAHLIASDASGSAQPAHGGHAGLHGAGAVAGRAAGRAHGRLGGGRACSTSCSPGDCPFQVVTEDGAARAGDVRGAGALGARAPPGDARGGGERCWPWRWPRIRPGASRRPGSCEQELRELPGAARPLERTGPRSRPPAHQQSCQVTLVVLPAHGPRTASSSRWIPRTWASWRRPSTRPAPRSSERHGGFIRPVTWGAKCSPASAVRRCGRMTRSGRCARRCSWSGTCPKRSRQTLPYLPSHAWP